MLNGAASLFGPPGRNLMVDLCGGTDGLASTEREVEAAGQRTSVLRRSRHRLKMGQSIGRSGDCVFCGILSGDVPASFVHEDALTVAFLDIRPVTKGHVLVVPRRHRLRLDDVDDHEALAMWTAARKIAKAAQESLHASGANLLLADGSSAGQEVDHLHLHVIPRYRLDDLVFKARAWNQPAPERDQLVETASLLATALAEKLDR